MGIVQQMTMRATIQRDEAVNDEYGNKGFPVWNIIGEDIPCYVWEKSGTKVTDAGKVVAVVLIKCAMQLNTDIKEGDRLYQVRDRLGVEVYGILYVDTIMKNRKYMNIGLRKHA